MQCTIEKSLEILENTPAALQAMLLHLSDEWIYASEGHNTWNSVQIIAHLIICEQTDWLPRIQIIMNDNPDIVLSALDMEAHFALARQHSISTLLQEFSILRQNSLMQLRAMNIQAADMSKTAIHPRFGSISLQQIIAAWTVHDMSHIAQIMRIMSGQYKEYTGPFGQLLRILN
jgi:hypothetical protein